MSWKESKPILAHITTNTTHIPVYQPEATQTGQLKECWDVFLGKVMTESRNEHYYKGLKIDQSSMIKFISPMHLPVKLIKSNLRFLHLR